MSNRKKAPAYQRDGALVQHTKESAKEVLGKVFEQLTDVAATDKFFPKGIELIHVELDVGVVKVVVKIAGPKPGQAEALPTP